MGQQKIRSIELRASGKSQGGHYFIILDTGRRIHKHLWNYLQMHNEAADRIHVLESCNK